MTTKVPPVFWVPIACLWVAVAVVGAINGDGFTAAVALGSLALLVLLLRLETLQRKRISILQTTVTLLDAKLNQQRQRKTTL